MKTAVITLKDSPNYGGILQSYSLQKAIIELGHECTLIDYTNIDFKGSIHSVGNHRIWGWYIGFIKRYSTQSCIR